jgi:hypothetical protein
MAKPKELATRPHPLRSTGAAADIENAGLVAVQAHLSFSTGRHSRYLSFSDGQISYDAAHAPPPRPSREAE